MPENYSNLIKLAGHSVLVTGAARGIGFAIAETFSRAGAQVYLNGRNEQSLTAASQKLNSAGGQTHTATFDISDSDATARWFKDDPPVLDMLVNNASVRDRRNFAELDATAFGNLLQTNLTAAYDLCRQFTLMETGGQNRAVVNIGSIAGLLGRPDDVAYSAAKGGLMAMTRSLAIDFAPYDIRCNAVAPGFIATETNEQMIDDDKVNDFLQRRVPMKRWGSPNEIAAAVLFLTSPAASYINGHVLTVDGGLTTSF